MMDWNCSATLIGSLPHSSAKEAVDLILGTENLIPSWPQLPKLGFGENMYGQFAVRLPGIMVDEEEQRLTVDLTAYDPMEFYTMLLSEELDYFENPPSNFAGLHELLSRGVRAKTVKGQVTGPVSAGLQILDQGGKPVIYDENYCEILRKGLNMMARWQQARLSSLGDTIMFVDEPSLSLMGTPFASIDQDDAVRWIDDVLDGIEGYKAIHCCGNTDWPTVLRTGIDILSFDAYAYGHTLPLYPEEVSAFIERGGSIAWGIVPNTDEELERVSSDMILENLEACLDAMASKGIDRDLLIRRSIVTPQCGLGGLDVGGSERALSMLSHLSSSLRERYSLG
jgi:methionine synthase II (cobalamin-independent)